MRENVQLSIVTVVLNDRKGFLATAQSVVPQLTSGVEWIVIDGVSSDGTLEEIKAYGARISTMISEPDHGIYHAMNKGAALCSGEYIVFMNAGGIFTDGAIQIALGHIVNSGRGEVLCGDWYVIGGSRPVLNIAEPDLITKYMSLSHQATFIPNDMFHSFGGYSDKYTLAADYDLLVRMACKGVRFKAIGGPLVHFYRGGATDRGYLKSMSETIKILWANKSPHRLAGTRIYICAALSRMITGR